MLRVWLGCALFCNACAASPAAVRDPGSQRSAEHFFAALRDDDADRAYDLLSAELKRSMSLEVYRELWKDNRTELQALARRVQETDTQLDTHARVQLEGGEQVVMVFEHGGWRLSGGVLDAQAMRTPLDTVAELRRALRRQNLPGLLRLLSSERRAAWQAAFEQSIEDTEDPLDLEVEVRGDEATVHTTGGGSIVLRREAGQWRIWDVE